MNRQSVRKTLLASGGIVAAGLVFLSWTTLTAFSSEEGTSLLYIDQDDTADSVYHKLNDVASAGKVPVFRLAASLTGYASHVRPGCYNVGDGANLLTVFRRLRGGLQTPVSLTIPNVRTMEQLAARLSRQLAADSATLARAFRDTALCAQFDCDTATLPCLFIPNTYEVFWTISATDLLKRMQRESQAFWTDGRKAKAREAGLTEKEVITLASIVDQETANNAEKPAIAGMYLNRLKQGMKLQADPTVKFALRDFALRRIMHEHLTVDSPYNTYLYEGLPPGPIDIPSVESIDAVLNFAHHDYIYMCAKEDFSGTHNFAKTYAEHLQNAARYAKALNERNIH